LILIFYNFFSFEFYFSGGFLDILLLFGDDAEKVLEGFLEFVLTVFVNAIGYKKTLSNSESSSFGRRVNLIKIVF
jgi:hypothetical protein